MPCGLGSSERPASLLCGRCVKGPLNSVGASKKGKKDLSTVLKPIKQGEQQVCSNSVCSLLLHKNCITQVRQFGMLRSTATDGRSQAYTSATIILRLIHST